jgi:hypothetical protein
MMHALVDSGPVAVGIAVPDSNMLYRSGIYVENRAPGQEVGREGRGRDAKRGRGGEAERQRGRERVRRRGDEVERGWWRGLEW